ncbi:MAG: AI-2E family transporter [Acidobacteria bacterium]|nr:AI-2E family transporter [Acidobacteriota bacterium]
MIKALVVIGVASVLLAYLVAPMALYLQRWVRHGPDRRPMSRSVAILLIFAAGGLVALTADLALGPRYEFQWTDVQRELPRHAERAISRIRGLERVPQVLGLPLDLERSAIDITMRAALAFEREVRLVMDEILGGLRFVSWLAFAPLVSLLLLESFPAFRRSTMRAMPSDHLAWRSSELLSHVNMVLAAYLRAQVVSALFVATVTTVLLLALRVPNGLVLGLAAGVLEFLPVVGPLTIALAVSVMTDGPTLVAALTGLALLRLVQDYVVLPRLLGRSMHLHPAAVVLAIFVGAHLGGVLGVLVAVPFVGLSAVAWRHWRDYRAIEQLVREHAREVSQVEGRPDGTGPGPTGSGTPPESSGAV